MKNNTDSKFGKCILIFGCRKRNEDYIYKDEIMDLNSTGVYTATFEAFSREDVLTNLLTPSQITRYTSKTSSNIRKTCSIR